MASGFTRLRSRTVVIVRPVLLGMALVASLGLGARDTSATHVRSRIPAAGSRWPLPNLDAEKLFTMEAPLGEVGVIDTDYRFSIAQRILLLSSWRWTAVRRLA
jgi:hypothetical protein